VVVAASASRMVRATATAITAAAAAARKLAWNAVRFIATRPATSRVGPTAASTVVSRATPTAPPSCLPALKIGEACPVRALVMVAHGLAWAMNTNERVLEEQGGQVQRAEVGDRAERVEAGRGAEQAVAEQPQVD
jgi:hypothetical protein